MMRAAPVGTAGVAVGAATGVAAAAASFVLELFGGSFFFGGLLFWASAKEGKLIKISRMMRQVFETVDWGMAFLDG
jgi:hypothetical protein